MTFGQIIKQKRKEKDWTQEELAGMLHVSAQAVSRWETGDAMPDISLLAPIANLLEVSTDTLLGVDLSKKKQQIKEYLDRDNDLKMQAYTEETSNLAIENLREGLRKFPDSDEIRHALIIRLFSSSDKENWREMNRLCEEVLAHTDNIATEIPLLSLVCTRAKDTENEKRALELISKLPYISATTEQLRAKLLAGDEQDKAYRYVLHSAYVNISGALHHFACNRKGSTHEDILRYRKISEDIETVLYNDDLTKHSLHDEYQVARALSDAGDTENSIAYLLRAVEKLEDDTPISEISDLRPDADFQRNYYADTDPQQRKAENADTARWILDNIDREFSTAVLAHQKTPEIRERLASLAAMV